MMNISTRKTGKFSHRILTIPASFSYQLVPVKWLFNQSIFNPQLCFLHGQASILINLMEVVFPCSVRLIWLYYQQAGFLSKHGSKKITAKFSARWKFWAQSTMVNWNFTIKISMNKWIATLIYNSFYFWYQYLVRLFVVPSIDTLYMNLKLDQLLRKVLLIWSCL
jgi:hypothetical protein